MPRKTQNVPPEWSLKVEGLRRSRRMSQSAFGAHFGVSAMAVSRWERGVAQPSGTIYIQLGNLAVAEESGAVLAVAPDNWLDGCPVLETQIDERAGGTVLRSHLDPATGRALFVDVTRLGDAPSIEIRPHRWAVAGHNLPKVEGAGL